MVKKSISRRKVLRNSTGLAVGGTLMAGNVSASAGQGQGGVGYISESSYEKITGENNGDCVEGEDGWGETFYIDREAVGDDEGVLMNAPPSCNGQGQDQTFRGYRITAESDTSCSGGPDPDGRGPQVEPCCSWIFVNENRNVRFGIEQRITNVQTPCHDADEVSVYDDGDGSFTDGFDVVRITFAPVPDGGRGRNGNGRS